MSHMSMSIGFVYLSKSTTIALSIYHLIRSLLSRVRLLATRFGRPATLSTMTCMSNLADTNTKDKYSPSDDSKCMKVAAYRRAVVLHLF